MIHHDATHRSDAAKLHPPVRKPGGRMIYQGVAARVHGPGDPLRYTSGRLDANGRVLPPVEYRDRAELERIVKALPGTKMIVTHPDPKKAGGRLTDEPVVGVVLAARLDNDEAVIDFEITDHRGHAAINRGIRELSLGYGAKLDASWNQRGTEINHLAMVEFARCGSACQIRTDCAAPAETAPCACQHADRMPHPDQGIPHTMSNTPELADALRSLEAQRADAATRATNAEAAASAEKFRADTAEGKILELEKQISELRVQINAGATALETEAITREKLRADAAEALVKNFDSTYEARLRERVKLERRASTVMADLRMDDLDDREIMATVVKHLDSAADVGAGVADGVIHGRFLALTERHDSSARALARVAEITATSTRAASKAEKKASKANDWQKPLPTAARIRGGK